MAWILLQHLVLLIKEGCRSVLYSNSKVVYSCSEDPNERL